MTCVDWILSLFLKPLSLFLLFQGLPGPIGPVGPKGARVCTRLLPVWCMIATYSGVIVTFELSERAYSYRFQVICIVLSFKVKWFDLDSRREIFTTTASLFFHPPGFSSFCFLSQQRLKHDKSAADSWPSHKCAFMCVFSLLRSH